MNVGSFENGINKYRNRISEKIKANGVYIQIEDGYTYSVGMNKYGLPEFVCGLNYEECLELMLIIIKAKELEFSDIKVGKHIKNIIHPEPFVMEISESEKRDIFHGGRSYYSTWNFKAAKLIL